MPILVPSPLPSPSLAKPPEELPSLDPIRSSSFLLLFLPHRCFITTSFHSHSTFVHGKYFVREQYCVRAQSAVCALTKYCFPAKFASSQNILSRHNISIFFTFRPDAILCWEIVFHRRIWTDCHPLKPHQLHDLWYSDVRRFTYKSKSKRVMVTHEYGRCPIDEFSVLVVFGFVRNKKSDSLVVMHGRKI